MRQTTDPSTRRRTPAIGPWLLGGAFVALWAVTGSLLAAIALMGLALLGAVLYGSVMGHSR